MSDTTTTTTPRVTSERQANPAIVSALSGLVAASIGKSIMHPVDTIKAKLQVISMPQNMHEGGPPTVNLIKGQSVIKQLVEQTVKTEGIRGLYKGFGIHVLGAVPAGGLYYGSYELFKRHTLENEFLQRHSFMAYLAGGLFAETISCIIFVPVDVIKERRQVQANLKNFEYTGDINAFRQILKTEGLNGLYRAYGATVGSFGPFSALYFMFYEHFKGFFIKNDAMSYLQRTSGQNPVKQEVTMAQAMLCSMGAGAFASILTNPLDMAKLRMQVMRAGQTGGGAKQSEQYYKHMMDGVYKIARDEGARALFSGSLARILFHVPNVAITMTAVEMIKPVVANMLIS